MRKTIIIQRHEIKVSDEIKLNKTQLTYRKSLCTLYFMIKSAFPILYVNTQNKTRFTKAKIKFPKM